MHIAWVITILYLLAFALAVAIQHRIQYRDEIRIKTKTILKKGILGKLLFIAEITIVLIASHTLNRGYIDKIEPSPTPPPRYEQVTYSNGRETGRVILDENKNIYRSVEEIREGNKSVWKIMSVCIIGVNHLLGAIAAIWTVDRAFKRKFKRPPPLPAP